MNFLSFLRPVQLALQLVPPRVEPIAEGPASAAIDAASLERLLEARLREPVAVAVHDNRSIMFSYRRVDGSLRLRLHRMFLPAPPDLAAVLEDFIAARGRRRTAASQWLDRYIREHREAIRAPKVRPSPQALGKTHDLQAIYDRVNAQFFAGGVDAQIGWSRAPRRRHRRRTIKMGVYLHESRQIRIHPSLDRPEVPSFVVEFVVYHEMCHQTCPPEGPPSGRKRIHTQAFRARERLHPDRDRALEWEKRNLRLLLSSRT